MNRELLSLQFLLVFFPSIACFCQDTITVNQTIRDGTFLISKGNKFALGFFSPGKSSNRYLGIWYHKVPGKTTVWIANRNSPINGFSGVLSLDEKHGGLVLYGDYHVKEAPIWSTNVSAKTTEETFVAQLHDSGNFVLFQETSRQVVWQSFDYPVDTFLKGMKLGVDRKTGLQRMLTSWRSADDPGKGDYLLKIDQSAFPQFLLYRGSKLYYRIHPLGRVVSNLFTFSFVDSEDEVSYIYTNHDASFNSRVIMDNSGSIKLLAWHEIENKWKEFFSIPNTWCDFYGNCEANSKCGNFYFQCTCLPGYKPKLSRSWNLEDGSGGCIRKRNKSSSAFEDGDGFVKVENVKLPDTSTAMWLNNSTSLMDCEVDCKRNHSCSAYALVYVLEKVVGCLAWYQDLIDVEEVIDGLDVYIRVDAIELAESLRRKEHRFFKDKGVIVLLVLSVVSGWLAFFALAYIWFKRRKNKRFLATVTDSGHIREILLKQEHRGSRRQLDLIFFSIKSILAATNNFAPTNILGQGGFGSVYKGQLLDQQEIAVKRLSKNSKQGVEEFKNEIVLIAKLQHRNLVKLLGCCIEGGEQILVYEYLPNKSLDIFLLDPTKRSILDWRKRAEIIMGIARGILYLHHDSRLRVIHRDLKCSNILLDKEMNPKISDFGMARMFQTNQIQDKTTKVVGTFGYMSPEYAAFGKFSTKSDVFGFGVILIEILTGKKNSNFFEEDDASFSLIGYVWDLWRQDRALEIIDSTLEQKFPTHEALRCIQVGLLCVQEDAIERPSMLTVVQMLNSESSLPSPGEPAFLFKNYSRRDNKKLSQTLKQESCSINRVTISELLSR